MPDRGSVTHWFDQLQTGNPGAVQNLWDQYFAQWVSLARQERTVERRPHRIRDIGEQEMPS
jgi:hypothetical protein